MKYIILFIFSFSILFAQDNFLDEIVLNEVERIYPNDEIVAPNSFNISINFDLNRYRLNEPITMEIKIYAQKGEISFTNSINPFNNYKFTVYDNYNNKVVSSDNYTLWKYQNERTIDNSKDRVITLREGESYSFFIDLNNWFYFTKSGRYRIEATFNPMPDLTEKYVIKADDAYFFIDEPLKSVSTQSTNNIVVARTSTNSASTLPVYYPDEVVTYTLDTMKRKEWSNYFNYMHMPSIISISQRYSEAYRKNYSNTYLEDFTDTGIYQKAARLSFQNFLKEQFSDTVSVNMIRTNFGNNFLNDLENAYKSENIRELAVRFDILYRTSLPEEKKALFDEFKKYLASAYDRNLRNQFMTELRRNIVSTKDTALKNHYTMVLDMMTKEYDAASVYTLLNYTVDKVTITEEYGLKRAQVEVTMYNRFFNMNTGDVYDPTVKRIFILRKMGEYWYIVNYYDTVMR